MRRTIAAAFAALSLLHAAYAAAQPAPPTIAGIIVLPTVELARPGGWEPAASGIDASRVPWLDSPSFRAEIQRYMGATLDIPSVERVRERIAGFSARHGRPFVRVAVPEQDATNGVVQVVVTEGRLGALTIEGARHFSEDDYRAALNLVTGEPIEAGKVDAAVRWLNANPYRSVTPIAMSGATGGTTDLVLQVRDRLPLGVGASVGNTGNPRNGEVQIGTSIDWGNAFGRGDLLNARYTTSRDRVINQYGVGYTANLPWRHAISVNGSYATTRPDARGSAISTEGISSGASARYALMPNAFADRLAIGVDYRRTDNDVLFGGESIFATAAVVVQAVGEYATSIRSPLGVTSASITAVYSPGGIGSQNTDAIFEQQRLGAKARYGYGRVALGQTGLLPWGFNWDVRATAQVSSAPLLSTEQLGFGGDGSLRGFTSFAANRDEGVIANAELQLPTARGLLFGRGGANADALGVFLFADFGTGRQRGEGTGSLTLASAGPGLRYQAGRFGSLQLAYGRVLRKTGLADAKDYRLHFQVQAGF